MMMGYGGMGYGGMGYGGAGYGGFGGFALFILALVILALGYLFLRARHGGRLFNMTPQGPGQSTTAYPTYRAGAAASGPEDEAMAALAARLASGDITPEDYRDRVATLRRVRDEGADPTAGMPYLGPEDGPEATRRAA